MHRRLYAKWHALLMLLGLVMVVPSNAMAQFLSLADEAKAVSALIKCPSPSLQADSDLPPLWSCLLPSKEVVKIFINGDAGKGVKNVKIMWNDWTKDIGHGRHTDQSIAEAWVATLATRYAPDQVSQLLDAFRAEKPTLI